MINELKTLINKHPNSWSIKLKTKYKHLLEFVNKSLENYNDLPLPTKIYWILNNISTYPKCIVCGKELKHDIRCHVIHGYKTKTCSAKCGSLNPESLAKRNKTLSEKYGDYNLYLSNKLKETLSNRTENEQLEINKKREETCLEKYGVSNIKSNNNIKLKSSETFKSTFKNNKDKILAKRNKTLSEKYGDYNLYLSNKLKETLSNRTENEQLEINKKREETCLEKYGVSSITLTNNFKQAFQNTRRTNIYNSFSKNPDVEPLFSLNEYLLNPLNEFKWKCKKCGNEFLSEPHRHQTHLARCEKCYPLTSIISQCEKQLQNFLMDNNINIETNNRNIIKPLELDIYIPKKKLAIEFNGLYFHSFGKHCPEKDYHLNKTELCENQGIQLIHIFEDDWNNKQEIVKSRLKNLLGIYNNIVYARNCEVKLVDNSVSKQFQINNHIQGFTNAKINCGLYYNNELISLMTFGKSRFNKKYEYELLRFCNKLGYHIPGAASKLLKYFERMYNPKSLISYADRCWSKGNMYEKLGFNLLGKSKPNYWYWKNNIKESRLKYQKHKLKDILEKFDENLSESENMKLNGYNRIYDCGNLVYVKEY